MHVAQLRRSGQCAVVEMQGGQGVRRHDLQMRVVIQSRAVRIHDEGRDATRTRRHIGFGKHHIEMCQAAVADPGFAAVHHKAVCSEADMGLHPRHIRARIRLTERKRGNHLATCHRGEVVRLLRGCACQGDGPTAQALHRECEIGQG